MTESIPEPAEDKTFVVVRRPNGAFLMWVRDNKAHPPWSPITDDPSIPNHGWGWITPGAEEIWIVGEKIK